MPAPSPHDRLIPIVLGVVGHRDIHPDAVDPLRASLNSVFAEFEQAYPNSPLVALTPLAPGADQLVAEVALARPDSRWTVRAPLAFEPEVFLQSTSFHSGGQVVAADQDRFRTLTADRRVDWFVVPVPSAMEQRVRDAGLTVEDIAAKRPGEVAEAAALRAAYYANPGGYIVRHCHTLIALWDEKHIDRPSGTHESVRFQLGGLSLTHYPWTAHEPLGFDGDRGPAIILHTPRADDEGKQRKATPDELARAGERTVRVPCGADDQYGLYYGRRVNVPCLARRIGILGRLRQLASRIKRSWGERPQHAERYDPAKSPVPTSDREYDQFLAICQAIDDYNAAAARIPTHDQAYAGRVTSADQTTAELFREGEAGPNSLYDTTLGDWFRKFSVVRETAAHLSGRLTPVANRAPWVVSGWLFVILAVLHVYAHPPWHTDSYTPPDHPTWLLVLFFALWVLLGVAVCVLWFLRAEESRVDYRSLAEALRTRQAWAAAGLGRSVSDSYLGQLRGELVWVRRALQHLCPPPQFWAEQFDRLPRERQVERLKWVEEKWVRGQLRQHRKASHDNHTSGRRLRRTGFVTFLVGLGVLCVPFALPHTQYTKSDGKPHHETAEGVPPAVLAVTGGAATPPAPADKHTEKDAHAPSVFGTDTHPAMFILCGGGLLVVLGGVLVAVCEKLGFETLARQYEQIYVVFRGGARELEVVLNPPLLCEMRGRHPEQPAFDPTKVPPPTPNQIDVQRAQQVVESLGREAVQESAQWLLVRRSKPLELPLGA